jgi:hypothetical protein
VLCSTGDPNRFVIHGYTRFQPYDSVSAISQRDQNHYDFLNEDATQVKIVDTISAMWDSKIRHAWDMTRDCKHTLFTRCR